MKDRHLLINAILDKLAALPLRDIIYVNEDGLLVINEKIVDVEETKLLRESAKVALSNKSLNLVRSQVLYQAYTFGVNSSTNFEQLYFGKAAVWWGQEEDKKLKLLATYGESREFAP